MGRSLEGDVLLIVDGEQVWIDGEEFYRVSGGDSIELDGERVELASKFHCEHETDNKGTLHLEVIVEGRQIHENITFIDKDDILRYFINEGKVFSRPLSALGRTGFIQGKPW